MRIVLHKTFSKKFSKLPKSVQAKFLERLQLFTKDASNPLLNNHSVEKRFPGCRSINITGDYRAIFKDEPSASVFITIGTHAELYG